MLKKALLAILAAVVLPQAARAAAGPIKIGMTVPGLKFPFFVIMKNDAEKAAAKLGATIVFADAQNDSSKQAADVENFVAQGVQAILISPMTVDSLVPAIEAAVKAGIPVATVDRKANTDQVTIGFDATPDAFQYMKEGKLNATIDQFPGKQAGDALKYLVDYVKDKKKPAKQVVYINPAPVTKAP